MKRLYALCCGLIPFLCSKGRIAFNRWRSRMKVYNHGLNAKHVLYVQPAVDYPEAPAEWKEADGRPKLFSIEFVRGVAEVDKNLGDYLIEKGLAKKTKIHMPSEVA